MSWLFSQALVAGFSAVTCSAGAPSAPLNTTPTPQAYCSPDKMTECSRLSRFGMTFEPLTDDRGEELLMSFLEGSRAKTLARQEEAQASTASGLACGEKWPESLVKYDHDSYSWKTHRCLWEEELPWSSVILPRWGMTLTGVVLQHPMLERPIKGIDSGLWPTPRVFMHKDSTVDRGKSNLGEVVGGPLNPNWIEWLMGWPIGWTDLQPLEMAKCHCARPLLGDCLQTFNCWERNFKRQLEISL